MTARHQLEEAFFKKVHSGNLVYNTCWEDPRCDRKVLNLNEESRVVMLTSAGCNALDYLLDHPAAIYAIDVNPRQNALLQLKKSLFKVGDHQDLYNYFGTGAFDEAHDFYSDLLKPTMSDPYTRKFWDSHIGDFFSGKGLRKTFYWRGSSGTVAWLVNKWLKTQPETERLIRQMLASQTLSEQQQWYEELEPRFLKGFLSWFIGRHAVQSMLGVPKSQQQLARSTYSDGMAGYIRQCMRRVFAGIPVQDNYFWQLYFYGQYQPGICPNYLLQENFNPIRNNIDRVTTYSMTLSDFLTQHPGQYTHFVLLDHQDWLAEHNYPALEQEWKLIFENAAPGASILMRSAASTPDFLPKWVPERLRFDHEAAAWSHANDRVGTYAGTFIAKIA
ncbi:MAG: BtaA family protein [Bacteroidota bacterium]